MSILGILFIGILLTPQVFAEETSESVEITQELPKEGRGISVGTSTLQGTYALGSSSQGIVTLNFRYVPLVTAAINDSPAIVFKLPTEISTQLNTTAKQQNFLAALTGTVTMPNGILGNASYDLHDTTKDFSLAYNAANGLVYVLYPKSTGILLLTNRWEVNMQFDVAALYKKGITIPPESNGTSYAIAGDFTDVSTGISIITGNQKTGIINTPSMAIGNLPVITAPTITSPVTHLQTVLTGNIQQTQLAGYTYTAEVTIVRHDGTTNPAVVTGIAVNTSGVYTTTLPAALEYGDTINTVVVASSQSTADVYRSPPSATTTVTWPISTTTSLTAQVGTTQISGVAAQTNAGVYRASVQINGGTAYTATLAANGAFQVTGVPMLLGGEQITVTIQGLSTRTGAVLVQSTVFSHTVAYLMPQLGNTLVLERLNASGAWEAATSAVTGQTIRYTTTITLNNQYATWKNQTLTSYIPTGLSQVSVATLNQQSSAGVTTPLTGLQLLTDGGSGQQYWYYKNSLDINNFTQQNTKMILQYTGVVNSNMSGQNLTFTGSINGTNAGNVAITQINLPASLPIKKGTLRFVTTPSQISFRNLLVPTKKTVFRSTAVDLPLVVADGRVSKTQWHLYLQETQAVHSTTTSKTISQAFVYLKNGASTAINALPTEIFSYTSPDENNVTVGWDQQNGVFLQLQPDVNINANETYTGQLQWTLTDAPL